MKELGAGKVSIIIPKRKEDNIDGCLKAIRKSTYRNYEIIIIDEGKERSYQRNVGIKKAKGEYLLILDSDMYITPHLISECVELMNKYDALYIPETIKTKGLFAKIRNWERQFYNMTPIDVVRFVRAKNCPLFDENMSGPEDSDWDRRVKGKRTITYNDYHHYDNVSLLSYCKKKKYYTTSMGYFQEKNPNDKILNIKWRCWGVFTENCKWKRFFRNPFFVIATMFVLFLRGIIYYSTKRR